MTILNHWFIFIAGMLFLASWQYFINGRVYGFCCLLLAILGIILDIIIQACLTVAGIFRKRIKLDEYEKEIS